MKYCALLIFLSNLIFSSCISFSNHGLFWSVSPKTGSNITQDKSWEVIESSNLTITLTATKSVLIVYHVVVEGFKSTYALPFPREDKKDILQIRCLINGQAYRYSSSFVSTYGVEDKVQIELSSSFVVILQTGLNYISLQWRKRGTQIDKWIISSPYLGSGFSLAALADHDDIYYLHENTNSVIVDTNAWKNLSNVLSFDLNSRSNITIGYSFAAQPQLGTFVKSTALEYLSSRIVVDNVPYTLASDIHGSSTWNPITGNLNGYLSLILEEGYHNVYLQWRKVGKVYRNWLSSPSLYDGYASSRNLFVLVNNFNTPSYSEHNRQILSGDGVWRSIGDSLSIFLVKQSAVYISYGLPVTQYSNPNFDSFSWNLLNEISTRLLVDNIAYQYATNNLGFQSKVIANSFGNLAVILEAGYHTISLQWKGDNNVDWVNLNSLPDGFIQSENLLVLISSNNSIPSLYMPDKLYGYEDISINLSNISIYDIDEKISPGMHVSIDISVNIGSFSLSNDTNLYYQIINLYNTIDEINQMLSLVTYKPKTLYYGEDTLTISLSDLGNVGYGGAIEVTNSTIITIYPVDYPFSITFDRYQNISYNNGSVILNPIELFDIDATFYATYQVNISSVCGYISIDSESNSTVQLNYLNKSSNYISFISTYNYTQTSLQNIRYYPNINCTIYRYTDVISLEIGNVYNISQNLMEYLHLSIIINNTSPSIVYSSYPNWILDGLTVNNSGNKNISTIVISGLSDNDSRSLSSDINEFNGKSVYDNVKLESLFNDSRSEISLITIDSNNKYIFTMQFADNYMQISSGNYLPYSKSAFVYLSIDTYREDLFCLINSKYIYSVIYLTNSSLYCIINTYDVFSDNFEYSDYDDYQTIWLNIKSNSSSSSSNYISLTVSPQPVIYSVQYDFAYIWSNSLLTLSTNNIKASLRCLFNDSIWIDAYIDDTKVFCRLPILSYYISNISIKLASYDLLFLSNSINISINSNPSITNLSLVAFNYNTYIQITLSNTSEYLFQNIYPKCFIDKLEVKNKILNSDVILCLYSDISKYSNISLFLDNYYVFASLSDYYTESSTNNNESILYITDANYNKSRVYVYGFDFNSWRISNCVISNISYEVTVLPTNLVVCNDVSLTSHNEYQLYLYNNMTNQSTNIVSLLIYSNAYYITPEYGLADQLNQIYIVGNGFSYNKSYVCYFNGIPIIAIYISNESLMCESLYNQIGNISLIILQDNSIIIGDFVYEVYDPIILSISPTSGLSKNSNLISIYGYNFINVPIFCSFNNSVVTATYISSTMIQCLCPMSSSHGLALITVGSNDLSYKGEVLYNYINPVTLINAIIFRDIVIQNPSDVSNKSIEKYVTFYIFGDYFSLNLNIFCLFNNLNNEDRYSYIGTYVNSTIIECSILITLSQINDLNFNISVLFSEYDYISNSVTISYINPIVGSIDISDNFITVTGQNFILSDNLLCNVNNIYVTANSYISNESVICYLSSILYDSTNISLFLTINNVSSNTIFITYANPSIIKSIYPKGSLYNISTNVTIYGINLDKYMSTYSPICYFGDVIVLGDLINSSAIVCSSPVVSVPLEIYLTISINNGKNTLNNSQNFRFLDIISIQYVKPNTSFFLTSDLSKYVSIYQPDYIYPNQILYVFGDSFVDESVYCQFGNNSKTLAGYINDSVIICEMISLKNFLDDNAIYIDFSLYYNDLGIHTNSLLLTYVLPIVLETSSLSSGSIYGNTTIFFSGYNIESFGTILCYFNSSITTGTFVNHRLISCVSPSNKIPGDVNITISQNGIYAIGSFIYTYTDVYLSSIHPHGGPINKNTNVSIALSDIDLFEISIYNVGCYFNEFYSSGIIINAHILKCLSPVMISPGVVDVSVTLDGHSILLSKLQYRYIEDVHIDDFYPTQGSSYGNEVLMLYSNVSIISSRITCIFDNIGITEGLIISSNTINCITPAVYNYSSNISTHVYVYFPEYYMTSNSIVYLFVIPIKIYTANVTSGPTTGNTEVFIFGSNFNELSEIFCYFNYTTVIATYISTDMIKCLSPNHSYGNVSITVSQDNITSIGSLIFEYISLSMIVGSNTKFLSIYSESNLIVYGYGFNVNSDVACIFNDSLSFGEVVNDKKLLCSVPVVTYDSYLAYFFMEDSMFYNPVYVTVTVNNAPIEGFVEFYYVDTLNIYSLTKKYVSIYDNSTIGVIGSYFHPSMNLICQFGSAEKNSAIFVNNTMILCPYYDISDYIISYSILTFHIYLKFGDLQSNSLEIVYEYPIEISYIDPNISSTLGGTKITIYGKNFYSNGSILCLFDLTSVIGYYISNSQISCIVPSHSTGSINFTVIQDNIYSSDYLKFTYTSIPKITSIFPKGSLTNIAQNISVFGNGFDLLRNPLCNFNDESTSAYVLSDNEIFCANPISNVSTSSEFTVYIDEYSKTSTNGILTFSYFNHIIINSYYPKASSIYGGNYLYLSGKFNETRSNVYCSFSSLSKTLAVFVNNSVITCEIPDVSAYDFELDIDVYLIYSDFNITSNYISFQYVKPVEVYKIYPIYGPFNGGNVLSIYGSGFQSYSYIECHFNNTIVNATYITPYLTECITPPSNIGIINISIYQNSIKAYNSYEFSYIESPVVNLINPKYSLLDGGTKVYIYGNYFNSIEDSSISCNFNNTIVIGIFINSTTLFCVSPSIFLESTVILNIYYDKFIFSQGNMFTYLNISNATENYYLQSNYISVSNHSLIKLVSNSEFSNLVPYKCLIEYQNNSNFMYLEYILLSNSLICNISKLTIGQYFVFITIDGFGIIYQDSFHILNYITILDLTIIVSSNYSRYGILVLNNLYDYDFKWKCIVGSHSIDSFARFNEIVICDLTNIYSYDFDIFIESNYGFVHSNSVNLNNHDPVHVELSNDFIAYLLNYSNIYDLFSYVFDYHISVISTKNSSKLLNSSHLDFYTNSYPNESYSYFIHQSQISTILDKWIKFSFEMNNRSIENDIYFYTEPMNTYTHISKLYSDLRLYENINKTLDNYIDTVIIQNDQEDVYLEKLYNLLSISCYIDDEYPCYILRNRWDFVSNELTNLIYDKPISNFQFNHKSFIETKNILLIDDVSSIYLSISNNTWITLTGRYFKNTTTCQLKNDFGYYISMHTEVITSFTLRCLISSKEQLSIYRDYIELRLFDNDLSISSGNSWILYYITYKSDLKSTNISILDTTKSRNISTSVCLSKYSCDNSLLLKSCQDIVVSDLIDSFSSFESYNDYFNVRFTKYDLNKDSFYLCQYSNSSSYYNFYKNYFRSNISINSIENAIDIVKSKNVFIIYPENIFVQLNINKTISLFIYGSNFSIIENYFINITDIYDLNINFLTQTCNYESIYLIQCMIQLPEIKPGSYFVNLYFENSQFIKSNTITFSFQNGSSSGKKLKSSMNIKYAVISSIEPSIIQINSSYNYISLYGTNLETIYMCRFISVDSQNHIYSNLSIYSDHIRCFTDDIKESENFYLEISYISNKYLYVSLNKMISFIFEPTLYYAINYYDYINVYGNLFSLSHRLIYCRIYSYQNSNVYMMVYGQIISNQLLQCNILSSQFKQKVLNVEISYNLVDFYMTSVYDNITNYNIVNYNNVLYRNNSGNNSVSELIPSYLTYSLLQRSYVCDGTILDKFPIYSNIDKFKYENINVYNFNYICEFKNVEGYHYSSKANIYDINLVACIIPSISPGDYVLTITNKDTNLSSSVSNIKCLIRPKIYHGLISSMSKYDGSNYIKFQGTGFDFSLNIHCIVNNKQSLITYDSNYIALCHVPYLLPGDTSIKLIYYQSVIFEKKFCINEIDIKNGIDLNLVSASKPCDNEPIINFSSKLDKDNDNSDFFYFSKKSIISISPTVGLVSGNTPVKIHIYDISSKHSYYCKFCNIKVLGIYISQNSLLCYSPSSNPNNCTVMVYDLTDRITYGSKRFIYYPEISISHVNPTYVCSNGGNEVQVILSYYIDDYVTYYCHFDNAYKVAARIINTNSLLCISPYTNKEYMKLSIGSEYEPWSNDSIINVLPNFISSSTYPLHGSYIGGTVVSISFNDFNIQIMKSPGCKFGNYFAESTYISTIGSLVCIAPTNNKSIGLVNLYIVDQSSQLSSPIYLNRYYYNKPADITSITPIYIETNFSYSLVVTGVNFMDSKDLSCLYDHKKINGRFVTSERIVCPISIAFEFNYISLFVSNNGIDKSDRFINIYNKNYRSIVSIHPSSGYILGGTPIYIKASTDIRNNYLYCRFGYLADVTAYKINNSTYVCITSKYIIGLINILIINENLILSNTTYEYIDIPAVFNSSHKYIVTNQFYSNIYIYGKGFHQFTVGKFHNQINDDVHKSSCVYISGNLLQCFIECSHKDELLYLDLSVNNGSDYIFNLLSVNTLSKVNIKSIYPFYVYSNHKGFIYVDIEINKLSYDSYICNYNTSKGLRFSYLGRFIDNSQVMCETPYLDIDNQLTLSLSIANETITQFTYLTIINLPDILNISTFYITSSGYTDLFFLYRRPAVYEYLRCKIGNMFFPMVHINSTCSSCQVYTDMFMLENDRTTTLHLFSKGYDDPIDTFDLFVYEVSNNITVNPYGLVSNQITTLSLDSLNCNFIPNIMKCRSNQAHVTTVYSSRCNIKCNILPFDNSQHSIIQLVISDNFKIDINKYTSIYSLFLEVMKQVAITSIVPSNGPSEQRNNIAIFGFEFPNYDDISCIFDYENVSSRAVYISSYELSCTTPELSPRISNISLYRNGVKISTNFLSRYEFLPLLQVQLISSNEISLSGGSELSLSISNINTQIYNVVVYSCRFNQIIVPAIVSSNVLYCVSPSLIFSESTYDIKMYLHIQVNGQDFSERILLNVNKPPTTIFIEPIFVRSTTQTNTFTVIFDRNIEYELMKCELDETILEAEFNENIMFCKYTESIKVGVHYLTIYYINSILEEIKITSHGSTIINRAYPLVNFNNISTLITMYSMYPIESTNTFLKCCFNYNNYTILADAAITGSNQIQCYSPVITSSKDYPVNLPIGLQEVDNNCYPISFTLSLRSFPTIVSVSTLSGPYIGGTYVYIQFSTKVSPYLETDNFDNSKSYIPIFCRIGAEGNLGSQFNSNTIACPTKKNIIGKYDIELSFNNIDYISTGVKFEYLPIISSNELIIPSSTPKIKYILPNSVSSGYSQSVHVYGDNFISGSRCFVANDIVLSTIYVSPNELICKTIVHSIGTDYISVINPVENQSNSVAINFTYSSSMYIDPIDGVNPSFGPKNAPTVITIYGNNFDLITPDVLCLIGNIWAYAFDITSNSLKCITPTNVISGNVIVNIATSNFDILPGFGLFAYIEDPIIYDTQPSKGYAGTQVLITGRGFSRISSLQCVIGDIISTTTIISDVSILCIVPENLDAGIYSLSLLTNGQHYVRSGSEFTYYIPATIDYLWPSNGPALRGSTIISLFGSNFQDTVDIYCIFGDSRVQAIIMSSTEMKCRTPSHIPDLVNVSVVSDGTLVYTSTSTLQFLFTPDVSVDKITPEFGYTAGDYPVIVFGSNFLNTSSLGCLFGDMKSRGVFLSNTSLLCLAPSPLGRALYASYNAVPVEVTNNGYDYSNSNITFQYSEPCDAGFFCPSSSRFLCPNGTYCPVNSRNFSLCQPGYFQPRQGQANCILCPVGYICPDSGMSRPVVCPIGQICDIMGLRAAYQSCPMGYYCLNATKASSTDQFKDIDYLYNNMTAWIEDLVTSAIYFNYSVYNWNYSSWPAPAHGRSRVLHPPAYQCDGYDCFPGSQNFLAEAPFPCPLGFYCRTGVGSQISIPKNFSTPQRCFDGYFCPRGSKSPEGSGPCPNGYFCPTQVDAIICPQGHYCPGVGNRAPIECYPGTYNPYQGRANCTVCPTGHICPGFGSVLPEPCPSGYVCITLGLSFPVVLCPQGYRCSEGTLTMDPSDPSPYKPIACQEGVFCLGGVSSSVPLSWVPSQPWGASHPQLCSEGTYCESGAYLSSGSGLCFPGHYCPPNTSFPISTPIGNFASSLGSVAPSLCYPGTYAPLISQVSCLPCPSGYTCQSYGTYQPTICSAGTYRAQVDAVTCNSCPKGTYSYEVGAPDISLCLPCPPTRICGILAMKNLNVTSDCQAGYVCGHATELAEQFSHPVPAGYYSSTNTLPSQEYDYPCLPGYYCERGTPNYTSTLNKCSIGYFCPQATPSPSIDILCPYLTTSGSGSYEITNCEIADVNVCDKLTIETYIPFQDVTYYDTFTYTLLDESGTNVTFDSSLLTTDPTGEVQVVNKVYIINETSSISPYQNDTIEAYRTCPFYGSSDANNIITIIGRNFVNTDSNYCKFRSCISSNRGYSIRRCKNQISSLNGDALPIAGIVSNATFITKAIYISPTRMKCEVPTYLFDSNVNATFEKNKYICRYVNSDGYFSYDKNVNNSYALIRECDSSTTCVNLPMNGYEYFTSLTIPCSAYDTSTIVVCPNNPESGYMFNPCISGEVLIELSNDGNYYSGGDNLSGTSLLSTVRFLEGGKIYRDYNNFTIPATFAVYTFVYPEYYYSNHAIIAMDTAMCLQPRYSEEGLRQREQGWFQLNAHEASNIEIDLRHIPSNMIYGQHYRLALFVIPSRCDINVCSSQRVRLPPSEYLPCRYPMYFSNWFNSSTVPKSQINNITIYALDDLIFKVEIHILYGLFSPYSNLFENSTTIYKLSPSRARSINGLPLSKVETRELSPYVSISRKLIPMQYLFCIVYYESTTNSIYQMFNTPPLYQDYERGRALIMYNASADNTAIPLVLDPTGIIDTSSTFWNQPATTAYESKEELDAYFETFQETTYDSTLGYTFAFTEMLMPYLPYFSNCYTFDSYIPFWMLVEGHECNLPNNYPHSWHRYKFPPLPDLDNIKVTGPFDFLQSPVADWCERNLTCNYEEDITTAYNNPRWFETSTGSVLFNFIRQPVDYFNYTGRQNVYPPTANDGGGALGINYYTTQSIDNIIPVYYDHTAGDAIFGCTTQCFGRQYTLAITYYQVDKYVKRIIAASLIGADYDFDQTNTQYELLVSYSALDWYGLILTFAFSLEIFIVLFIMIGILTVFLAQCSWFISRITTHLQYPPDLKFLKFYKLILPPPIIGITLAIIPIWLLTAFGNYVIYGYFITDPLNPQSKGLTLILDSIPNTYNGLGFVLSSTAQLNNRNGRVGTMFFVIGICCLVTGSKLYFPKPETKREKEIAKYRTLIALREKSWKPVLWKKSNFIFTSICNGILLVLLLEVSLWSQFGSHQFVVQTMMAIFSTVFEYIYSYQVDDAILVGPLNASFNFASQLITFGSANFLQFVLSYTYGIAITIFSRIYVNSYIDVLSDIFQRVSEKSLQVVIYLIPKYVMNNKDFVYIKKLLKREENLIKKRDVDGLIDVKTSSSDSIEPIIDTLSGMCSDTFVLYYFPYYVYLLLQYRNAIQLPIYYGITQSQMIIYLTFQLIAVIFEPIADVFTISTLELYHGWKVYDYLIYCRYRFLQRECRWKAYEDTVDECIDENLRKIDQMCFSSQYFLMLTVMANGILYISTAFECWLRSSYSPFSDPAFATLTLILVAMFIVIEQSLYYLAFYFNVYKVKHEDTAWHLNFKDDDEFNIPTWDDIKGASHDAYLMNQRITSETFRYKFLNYNRAWLISQLPQILTPRTLRRSRPNLLNQLSRIIYSYKKDLSSESETEETVKQRFGPVVLTTSSVNIIRWWLGKAKRRLKLKRIVDPLIKNARGSQCEQCLSRKQLQVEYEIDVDQMADKYDMEYPNNDEIDPIQWKSYWTKHQIYHTLCLTCITKRRDKGDEALGLPIAGIPTQSNQGRARKPPGGGSATDPSNDQKDFGPVYLSAASKAIMLNWYRKAQSKRNNKLLRKRRKVVKEISDDEGDDLRAPWTRDNLLLTPSTTAIATKWLKAAQNAIKKKSGMLVGSPKAAGVVEDRSQGLLPGKRSRFMKK